MPNELSTELKEFEMFFEDASKPPVLLTRKQKEALHTAILQKVEYLTLTNGVMMKRQEIKSIKPISEERRNAMLKPFRMLWTEESPVYFNKERVQIPINGKMVNLFWIRKKGRQGNEDITLSEGFAFRLWDWKNISEEGIQKLLPEFSRAKATIF